MMFFLRHHRQGGAHAWSLTAARVLAAMVAASVLIGTVTAASSWAPTLLVNTEAFQVIDDRDSGNNLVLKFGETVNETLTWNRTLGVFQFSDDLFVQGTISGSTLMINRNATFAASGVIITSSGQTVFNEQGRSVDFRVEAEGIPNMLLVDSSAGRIGVGTSAPQQYVHLYDTSGGSAGLRLETAGIAYTDLLQGTAGLNIDSSTNKVGIEKTDPSTTLDVVGIMSGTTVYATRSFSGAGLTDCDAAGQKLLWDATTGRFSCGTDASGSFGSGNVITIGDGRYVNVSGDTMTGALNIRVTGGGPTTQSLNVAGLMSGSTIHVSGTGGRLNPLLTTDLDFGALVMGTGALKNSGTGVMMPQLYVAGRQSSTYVGSGSLIGSVTSFDIQGNYSYVINTNAFDIFDITNPTRPQKVSTTTQASASDIAVEGNFAYVSGGAVMSVYDVRNPSSPALISRLTITGNGRRIDVQGGYAYIANSTNGSLQIIDISNPAVPVLVGTLGGLGFANDVVVEGKYAYVANDYLSIIDISNPTTPVLTGNRSDLSGAGGIKLAKQGRYVYVTSDDALFSVFDVINPASPTLRGQILGSGNYYGISVQGRYAYVTEVDNSSLLTIDITNDMLPTIIARTAVAGSPREVVVQGRYAHIGNTTVKAYNIYDLGGTYSQVLEAGAAQVGTLDVRDRITANDGRFIGGVTTAGLNVSGDASFSGSIKIAQGVNTASGGIIFSRTGSVVFNEQSRNVDFRIEGDTDANLIFMDASTDRVGIGTNLPDTKLEVIGTVSGSMIYAQRTLASSGTLVFEGAASGSSLYLGTSLQGAGLADCDTAATSKLLWDSSTGRFSCGTDQSGGSFGSGNVITIGDGRYVNVSGDTMTGALNIRVTGGTPTTQSLNVAGLMSGTTIHVSGTGATSAPLLTTDLDFGSLVIGTGALKNSGTGVMMPQFAIMGRPTLKIVGSGSLTSNPRQMTQQGNYVYVTNASDTLDILDVSNAQRPLKVGSISLGTTIRDVEVRGKYAYVTNQSSKSLSVVDVSNPSSPRLVGSGSFPKSPYFVVVQGNFAYTNVNDDILVMDISIPDRPVYVGSGSTNANSTYYMAVQDEYLYVVSIGDNVLVTMDISNPRRPIRVSSIALTGSAGPITIQERYLYAGSEGASNIMEIFDISNPASPVRKGRAGLTQSDSSAITVRGRYAYVLGISSTNSLNIVDVSNPSAPFKIGSIGLGAGVPIDLAVQGRYAYAAIFSDKSVRVVDLGGAYIQQLETGDIETASLGVEGSAVIRGNTDIRGALSVGQGINANGPSAITNTGTGGFALTISSNTGGLKIAADGRSVSPHLLFGTGTTFDTNLFRISANTLHTDDAFSVSGALMLESSLTGATIGGFGLTDCDASTSKLLWDSATGKFSCGTDQSGGSFGTGNVLTIGDSRYVNVSGDTMTGALNIRVTGGTPTTQSLNVAGLMSGTTLQVTGTGAAPILFTNITRGTVGIGTSNPIDPLHIISDVNSDAINIEENVGGESWQIGVDVDGDLNFENSTSTSITFSDGNAVGIGATSPSNKLEVVGSISGAVVIGTDSLRSSGSLVFEGAASGSSLYLGSRLDGAGLTDCDAAGQKLLWDTTTGRFSCGTDASGSFGTGNVLTIGDSRYVNVSGDTMTGALNINLTSGFRALNIAQWASGAYLHAEKGLSSSGGLVVEGAVTFGSTLTIGSVTYTFPGSDGSGSGYVLATNGAGQLSWAQLGTGSLKNRTLQIAVPLNTAAVTRDGADNDVNVYIGSQTGATTNPHQYYRAATSSGQLQDIDIRYKVQLPQNFINFTTLSNDIRFSYRTTSASAAVNAIDILVEDDDGDDAYIASEGQGLTSVSWTDFTNEFDGASFNPVAGEYIYITIKGYSTSSGDAYAGEILITYTGK